jgi:hypothetical protein
MMELESIQLEMETTEVTETLLQKEREAYQNCINPFRKEEEEWRLKSRSLWIQSGTPTQHISTSRHNIGAKKTQSKKYKWIQDKP